MIQIKRSELKQLAQNKLGNDSLESQNKILIKIATARCARLSYMTFDNEIDYEKDIELHDRLLQSGHMSPFEHCARAMSDEVYYKFVKGEILEINPDGEGNCEALDWKKAAGWCRNFKGFIQYREILEN